MGLNSNEDAYENPQITYFSRDQAVRLLKNMIGGGTEYTHVVVVSCRPRYVCTSAPGGMPQLLSVENGKLPMTTFHIDNEVLGAIPFWDKEITKFAFGSEPIARRRNHHLPEDCTHSILVVGLKENEEIDPARVNDDIELF